MNDNPLLAQYNHRAKVIHIVEGNLADRFLLCDKPPNHSRIDELRMEHINMAAEGGYELCKECREVVEDNNHPAMQVYNTANHLLHNL